MGRKVEISGVNTSELPVLDNDTMMRLFKKMQENGDGQARQRLVQGNLRLVLSTIQRFSNRGEPMDDLFQVGCVGLMKAIDNFDLSQGVRFSTYAVPMIVGEIRRYLRDNNPIRVSRSLRDTAYKALQMKDRLVHKNNEEPTLEEIAERLDIEVEEIVYALDAIQDPISLFEPVYQDGGDPIYVMDQVSDEKQDDGKWMNGIAVQQALQKLEPRQQKILSLRFFGDKTQMEVAGEIGISQAQVSRLEKKAIKKMRKYI